MVAEKIKPISVRLKDAVIVTGFSERTIRNKAAAGEIRQKKVGGCTLYSYEDLERLVGFEAREGGNNGNAQ